MKLQTRLTVSYSKQCNFPPKSHQTGLYTCKRQENVCCKVRGTRVRSGRAVPQLMSELVRKAEADIDALRGRLSMVGAAERGEGAAPSSSAALLQARALPPPRPPPRNQTKLLGPEPRWPALSQGWPGCHVNPALPVLLLCFLAQWRAVVLHRFLLAFQVRPLAEPRTVQWSDIFR